MEDSLIKLHKKLDEFEIVDEILEYIDDIQDMIEENKYNKDKIIEIESKYSIETRFLLVFENSEKIGFQNNYKNPDLQVLVNLRDRLYLIAIYKILKEEGREIPKDIVTKNYSELLKLIEE